MSLKYNAAREELDISGRSVEAENEMNDRSFFLSLPADGSGIGSYGSYIYEPIGLTCTVNTLSWYSGTPLHLEDTQMQTKMEVRNQM